MTRLLNILILDDDNICNFINRRVAEKSGFFQDIRSIHNGQDALKYLAEVAEGMHAVPDIILLDLNMPLMNGFDFIEAFQRLEFEHKEAVSIIILTSSDNTIDKARAISMGIAHYLTKPFTLKSLQSAVYSIYTQP